MTIRRDRKLEIEMSSKSLIDKGIEKILNRALPGGGFAQRDKGFFRPDATAWAIIALSFDKSNDGIVKSACECIATKQLPDGRVALMESLNSTWWPTPLAVLAWRKAAGFENATSAAVNFMLDSSGEHFPKEKDSPAGHDSTIRGWSWIEGTHSWLEPTCLSIIALRATGHARHGRVEEAIKMLMDRQLLAGGWNYGNTKVFQQELLPMPDHTGQALCALSGTALLSAVQQSISYAREQIDNLTSPFSLSWCLFGLKAWRSELTGIRERVLKSLALQERYGPYETTLIAQLIIAYRAEGDLLGYLGIE